MTQKLFVKTFGCQMNVYDSDRMSALLAKTHHLTLTDAEDEADVLLLNTCSVREKAQEKVFSQLGRWQALKVQKPDLIIGVGGCVASQEGANILDRAPYVDVVFGPQTLHRLPEMIDDVRQTHTPVVDIRFPEIEKFDRLPEPRAEGPTAFVSIMEGCSKYCSFCIVPYTRGKEFSRPFESVLTEIATLATQGVREINLLGQNVNAYRGILGNTQETADLALLIRTMVQIKGIDRIRYTTSHPVEFSQRLIETYADVPQLVDHLHLPVQSGSDRILMLMKRGHTALEYKSKIRQLRSIRPNISLSSDFIIGFPGETEVDFKATLDLIEEIGYDHSYSFIYSQRPGTPAANLPDTVTLATKKERLNQLQRRIREMVDTISKNMIGTVVSALIEKPATRAGELSARTENNRLVYFEGPTEWVGRFVNVKVLEATTYALKGKAVEIQTI